MAAKWLWADKSRSRYEVSNWPEADEMKARLRTARAHNAARYAQIALALHGHDCVLLATLSQQKFK
jgi:hypothetical protein